jgi:16S rRNA processing protein RimM
LTEVNVKSSQEVEDSFHISEIVGLTVKNLEGTTIGKVVDVMELPAQDTLVIEISNGSELLLPFVKKHVPEVNLDNNELVIDNYEGLL